MRLYSVENGLNQIQLLKKYCLQLDHQIDTLKRFINNFNANYIILNLPDNQSRYYYNNQQLEQLGILLRDENSNEQNPPYKYINPEKMLTHQVLDNVYEKDLYIYNTQKLIPQGFAVRHDGYNVDQTINYSIIPLANSGSYYTVQDFVIKEIGNNSVTTEITWELAENATDLYGLNYLFSLVLPGSRFFPQSSDGLFAFTSSPIYLFNFISTPALPGIATTNKGLWNIQYLLGHEFLLKKNNSYEEVTDDNYIKTQQVRVGEYPQSRYIIYTTIPEGILSNLKINLY